MPIRLRFRLANWPTRLQWLSLIALSGLLATGLESLNIPAALLLGPMLAGILFSIRGSQIQIPRIGFAAAQTLIGCMIAHSLQPEVIGVFIHNWWLFMGITLLVIAASILLGGLMTRWQVLPGMTALWGTSPGAASVMTLLAESQGADIRLVAFMQYLRVLMVAITASIVATLAVPETQTATAQSWAHWFPSLHPDDFATTLILAALGGWLGIKLKLPAGALLMPMLIGATLTLTGLINIELPPWLLAISYALLGWRIGLGFTVTILRYAAHALPKIILSIALLMGLCGLLAGLLIMLFDVDPLTAYMATSPGGLDTIAIISASTQVDVGFIMTFQTVRFVLVLLISPFVAKTLAKRLSHPAP